jgi:UDP-GlcNAc:undecaprenyl-phosphate GlcNAc-1-phosphate transferase
MPPVILSAAIAALIASLMTNLLVPVMTRLAVGFRVVDVPNERKAHAGEVPRLGGVAIVLGLAIGAGALAMMQWGSGNVEASRSELVALAFGTLMVFLVGLIDDVLGVSSLQKFFIELAAALLVVRVGWSFQALSLPWTGSIELGLWGDVASLLWIVGVTNAINLIDGLDGLAGGVVAIISASALAYALFQNNLLTAILMGAMVGATIGFLRHNWAPARIYMGDCGSLTLGFLLATISVHSSIKAPATVAILVPILALGVPVIDTLLVMLVRFLERPKGRIGSRFLRMFRADRQHLHHLLSHYGTRRSTVVASIYTLVILSCTLAFVVATTRSATLGLWLLVVEVVVVLAMRWMGLRAAARTLSDQKREEVRTELRG